MRKPFHLPPIMLYNLVPHGRWTHPQTAVTVKRTVNNHIFQCFAVRSCSDYFRFQPFLPYSLISKSAIRTEPPTISKHPMEIPPDVLLSFAGYSFDYPSGTPGLPTQVILTYLYFDFNYFFKFIYYNDFFNGRPLLNLNKHPFLYTFIIKFCTSCIKDNIP